MSVKHVLHPILHLVLNVLQEHIYMEQLVILIVLILPLTKILYLISVSLLVLTILKMDSV